MTTTDVDYATGTDLAALIAEASALTADEVVTHALARDVQLSHGAGTCVLITLDNGLDHTRPNTLGPRSLAELNSALDAARSRDDIAAIAITGKPFILAAGADLSGVVKITDPAHARAIAQIGHLVYDKLNAVPGSGDVPTFTFYNGLALGGGLEIGLHCSYRTVSAANPALALPECFLGLVPGWGGAWLLPNLIGPDAALSVIIVNALSQNRMLKGKQAYGLGLADAMFDGADFLERSLDWAARVVSGAITVERAEIDRVTTAGTRPWSRLARSPTPRCPALRRRRTERWIWSLPLKTSTRAEGFAAEDDALAELIMSPGAALGPVRLRPGAEAGQAARRAPRTRRWLVRSPRWAWSGPV